VTRSVGPKEAALRKARESKAGGEKAEGGDPEDRAEEAHGEEDGPAKVGKMLTSEKAERAKGDEGTRPVPNAALVKRLRNPPTSAERVRTP